MPKTRAKNSPTYLTRRRWTPQDAKEALAELAQSGLSMRAFAAREGLDVQRLMRWRRQLGTSTPAFEEVLRHDLVPSLGGAVGSVDDERFEVVLRSGRVVRVPALFDASALRRLLDIVDEVIPC